MITVGDVGKLSREIFRLRSPRRSISNCWPIFCMRVKTLSLFGASVPRDSPAFYFLCLGFLILTIVGTLNLLRSPTGRAFIAIRDSETAARSMIDQENVEKFAQDHNIPFTNYASLCRATEVQDLIWREIEAVNVNFARVETIKKFYLIERQLTPEDEELTPTMKLKRNFVNKRYAAEINAMYGERAVA